MVLVLIVGLLMLNLLIIHLKVLNLLSEKTIVKYTPIRGPLEKFPNCNFYNYPYNNTTAVHIKIDAEGVMMNYVWIGLFVLIIIINIAIIFGNLWDFINDMWRKNK